LDTRKKGVGFPSGKGNKASPSLQNQDLPQAYRRSPWANEAEAQKQEERSKEGGFEKNGQSVRHEDAKKGKSEKWEHTKHVFPREISNPGKQGTIRKKTTSLHSTKEGGKKTRGIKNQKNKTHKEGMQTKVKKKSN